MRVWTGLVLLMLAFASYAQDCHDHLQYGIQDEQGWVDRHLCRQAFAVGYSDYHKTPLWVAYRDNPGERLAHRRPAQRLSGGP